MSEQARTQRRIAKGLMPPGYWSALTACVLNGVWLGCMIVLEGMGDVAVQASTRPGLFRLSVGSALLITVAQVPILLATGALVFSRTPARALVGTMLWALYVPVNLVGYFSYGRLAPIVHSGALSADPDARTVAGLVEIGHPLALTGSLPVLGYGMLGLAWCIISTSLWRLGRLSKAASILLFGSGMLSVLGAVGSFLDVPWLAGACLLGGVVSLPALALLGLALWLEAPRALCGDG